MIKKNWKKIIVIILIIIVSTSIGAYAAIVLNADQVSYNKSGTNITVKAALDELDTKATNAPKVVFTQGQLVTYGGEQFYSLYNVTDKGTTMEIFAKTNLNSGATAQANAAMDTTACVFSSSLYWGNTVGLNLNLETGYAATDAIGKARSYAKAKGAISGRLLTKQEVGNITGANFDNYEDWSSMTNTKIKDMINGAGNSQGYEAYWLGSGGEGSAGSVWFVYGEDSVLGTFYYDDYYGVRPVLRVYKSDVTAAS